MILLLLAEVDPRSLNNDQLLDKTLNTQDKTKQALSRTLNMVEESKQVGLSTAEQLQEQNRKIGQIHDNILQMESNLQRADKVFLQSQWLNRKISLNLSLYI